MAAPNLTGIRFLTPDPTGFVLGKPNVFFITGSNLRGGQVARITGKLGASQQVDWSAVETLNSQSEFEIKVQAWPRLATAAQHMDLTGDAGDVTITVLNGGPAVRTFPINYGT